MLAGMISIAEGGLLAIAETAYVAAFAAIVSEEVLPLHIVSTAWNCVDMLDRTVPTEKEWVDLVVRDVCEKPVQPDYCAMFAVLCFAWKSIICPLNQLLRKLYARQTL